MNNRIRILIADNDLDTTQVILNYLKKVAHVEVLGLVKDGRDAIEMIRYSKPDVIIVSLQLDYYNGIEVLQKCIGSHCPLVILTSNSAIYGVKAFDLDVLDYLLKPFDEERLEACFVKVEARLRFNQ